MGFSLEEVDLPTLPDDLLSPIVDAVNLLNREEMPRRAAFNIAEFRAFNTTPWAMARRFVIRDESGRVAAVGDGRYQLDGSNPDVLSGTIRVVPDFRRMGIATMALAHVAAMAEELGRSRLMSWRTDTVPSGEAFCRAIGAVDTLNFDDSVLRLADLDIELMEQWEREGPQRASGYQVEIVDGAWEPSLLPQIARLFEILERDSPHSEGIEPRSWTAEQMVELQERNLREMDSLVAMAYGPDSDVVGMSQLLRRRRDPSTWIVTVTMVDPAHRGRALGKWLKAAVNLAAIEQWPGGVYSETGNAESNAAMLGINRAMGFRHEVTTTEVELGVDAALAFVRDRS